MLGLRRHPGEWLLIGSIRVVMRSKTAHGCLLSITMPGRPPQDLPLAADGPAIAIPGAPDVSICYGRGRSSNNRVLGITAPRHMRITRGEQLTSGGQEGRYCH